jgi:hypothetical protein
MVDGGECDGLCEIARCEASRMRRTEQGNQCICAPCCGFVLACMRVCMCVCILRSFALPSSSPQSVSQWHNIM